MKHYFLSLYALVPCLLLTACPRNQYDLTLKPDTDGLERTLICLRRDPDEGKALDFPEKELKSLMELYPDHKMEAEIRRYTFSGRVVGATPNDVGGTGMFLRQKTSMGSLSRYSERFRGNSDQWASAEQRGESADRFAEWLVSWLESELGRERGFMKLRKLLGEPFRHDMKNLGLILNQIDETDLDSSGSTGVQGLFSFVELYLYERGYFSLEEVAKLRALLEPDVEPEMLGFAERWLAGRMGFEEDAPLPEAFDFLNDAETLKTSLVQFMQGTEHYQARLGEWRTEIEGKEETAPPDPAEMFLHEGMAAFFDLEGSSGSTDDYLTAKLKLPVTPFFTNGEWDAETGVLSWEAKIESGKPSRLPVYFFATWTVPDEVFQKTHLGRVALSGEALQKYVTWVDALSMKKATEWEAFLAGLTPDGSLDSQLKQFRFDAEKSDEDSGFVNGARLIQGALKEKVAD